MRHDPRFRRGQVLILTLFATTVLLGSGAFLTDAVLAYTVRVRLHAALDAAVLAGVRASGEDRQAVAQQVFDANFPPGHMGMGPVSLDIQFSSGGEVIRASVRGSMPTTLMRVYDRSSLDISTYTEGEQSEGAKFLMLDEDNIDTDISSITTITYYLPFCGNGNPSMCVNDDIVALYQRATLFTRGVDITPYSGLVLPSGQVGDYGVFEFTSPDPQTSNQNGKQFTTQELIKSICAASDENNLDKIDGVRGLGADQLKDLVGAKVCALVYDSDISYDAAKGEASLKGSTKGLTAFTVTNWQPDPNGGSYLPHLVVDLARSSEVATICASAGKSNTSALITK